jgi:LysR family transcriptional activator of nhaA
MDGDVVAMNGASTASTRRSQFPSKPRSAPVDWLNYHHLFYFYVVAREGSIKRASENLRLAQPTISGQLKVFETAIGEALFERSGRSLQLTDVGRTVYRYADDIFGLGEKLLDTVRRRKPPEGLPLRIGISDTVPKTVAHQLLAPALRMVPAIALVCTEDKTGRLLAELADRDLDLVLSDAPLPPAGPIRAFSHLVRESGVTFLAMPQVRAQLDASRFPACLDDAPILLPTRGTEARQGLDAFFERSGVRPRIVAEFEDTALLKVFGERGAGVYVVPTSIADEVRALHRSVVVGATEEARERVYVITVDRRLVHPAVRRLVDVVRTEG